MYLHRRGATYYYRRPIPKNLIGVWLGPTGRPRKEWIVSLQTKDRRIAIARMDQASATFATLLKRQVLDRATQQGLPDGHKGDPMSYFTREDWDHFEAHQAFETDRSAQEEWDQENDPLYEQKQALREETMRLRDARFSREAGREVAAEERARAVASRAISFMSLFDDWSGKYGKPDTVAAYRTYAQAFSDFVDKADANAITEDNVADWRNSLESKGGLSGKALSPKTINGAYMCAIKTVFADATGRTRRLRSNPALNLRALRAVKKPKLREKSITDSEAVIILTDAMQPTEGRLSPKKLAAKRWCQWLMAYSGARVLEIAQLRKEDVGEVYRRPVHQYHT